MLAGDWLIEADYRYFHTAQAFSGTQPDNSGRPLVINLHSVDVNVTYAATDRTTIRLTVPLSTGRQSRWYGDSVPHAVDASGVGDASVVASSWLSDPLTHLSANVSLGIGVKVPTGRYQVQRAYYLPDSSNVQFAVDQSIEPGDGGWGIVLQGQAFRRLTRGLFAYFTGSYLVAPGDVSSVTRAPAGQKNDTLHYSEADVYTGRLGLTYDQFLVHGLSLSLGGRVDGIPYHDLIGKSDGFRRPAFIALVDPGVTLQQGPNTFTVGTPVRVAQRLATRGLNKSSGGAIGLGDLAKVLLFVGYARRF